MLNKISVFLASGFYLSHPVYKLSAGRTRLWRGCGLVGTAESFLLCLWLGPLSIGYPFWTANILILLTLISVPIARSAEEFYGHSDDPRVVIDEFVGFAWAGVWFVDSLYLMLAAAVLFRIFDVTKPLGIRKLEAIPNGWGCILDDVASGLLAAVVLAFINWASGI